MTANTPSAGRAKVGNNPYLVFSMDGFFVPTPIFYSRREAAAVLRISLRSVAYLIADGRLATRKIGGRRLVLVDSLNAYARKDHPRAIMPVASAA